MQAFLSNTAVTGVGAAQAATSGCIVKTCARVNAPLLRAGTFCATTCNRWSRLLKKDGGYQIHGIGCAPAEQGLTEEFRRVEVATIPDAAVPYINEMQRVVVKLTPWQEGNISFNTVKMARPARARVVVPTNDYAITGALSGVPRLEVFDCRVSEKHLTTVTNLVMKRMGNVKATPEYCWGQYKGKVAADMKRGQISFKTAAEEEEYLHILTLIFNAKCAERYLGDIVLCSTSFDRDTPFASGDGLFTHEFDQLGDALEKAWEAAKKAFGLDGGAVPALPATAFTGTPYEESFKVHMKDPITEEPLSLVDMTQYEDLVLFDADEFKPQAGACGPNIFGNRPPIDCKHVNSLLSAVTRHMSIAHKTVVLTNGEELNFVVDKLDNREKAMPIYKAKAWARITEAHEAAIDSFIDSFGAGELHRPSQMSIERFEELYTKIDDLHSEGEWGTLSRMVHFSCFLKQGEAGERARFITMPGRNAVDAQHHQAAVSPLVHIIEEMNAAYYNHRNFKGLTQEGKATRVGELITGYGEKRVTYGYDKSSNDRTWHLRDWLAFEKYLHAIANVVQKKTGDRYNADCFVGNLGARKPSKICYAFGVFSMVCEAVLFYLPSAINPTSLANRLNGDTTMLAVSEQLYGPEGFEKTFQWMHCPIALESDHGDPMHVEHWTGYAKGYSYMMGDAQIDPPLAYANEGDDTAVNITVPSKQTNAQAADNFTKALKACTGGQEIWEPAIVSAEHINRHGGTRSVVEVMSCVFSYHDAGVEQMVYFIPKPLKRADKMAWTMSRFFTYVERDDGDFAVVRDARYHALNCTRAFSMCVDLMYTLFSRWFVYRVGLYHYNELKKVDPTWEKPLYAERSMEARGLEDAPAYLGSSLTVVKDKIRDAFGMVPISRGVLQSNLDAWCIENPSVTKLEAETVMATLYCLDETMRDTDVEWDDIVDPRTFLQKLDFGILGGVCAGRCARMADAYAKAEAPPRSILEYLGKVKNAARDQKRRAEGRSPGDNVA